MNLLDYNYALFFLQYKILLSFLIKNLDFKFKYLFNN